MMQHHDMLWDKFICLYCESGLIGNTTSSLKRTTHGIQIKRISYTTPPSAFRGTFVLNAALEGKRRPRSLLAAVWCAAAQKMYSTRTFVL